MFYHICIYLIAGEGLWFGGVAGHVHGDG